MTLDLRSASYSLSIVASSRTEQPIETAPAVRRALEDQVLTLILDRPQQRNALDGVMREELAAALDHAARSDEIQAVVLTGAGRAFCAGGDLRGLADLHDSRLYRHLSHSLTSLLDAVERLEKPVVAALNGAATGAGLTLALCCDWRVAGPETRLLFGEGRLGLVPTHGGVTRLVKLVGLARAKEALLGGEDLDGDRALALGLVSEITQDDVVAEAHARARRMLRRAPLSFAATKRLAHLAANADLYSGILAESLAQTALLGSEDHREGLAAVRERRDPVFTGR